MFNKKQELFYNVEQGNRVYKDDVSNHNMFYSEFLLHCNDHLNWNYKIYYLEFKSKHNFFLNNDELEYLYTQNERVNEVLYYFFSKNIKKIKCDQKIDLFFLSNLKYLGLLVLIPKLDLFNKYYFNLILIVKKEFDTDQFYNWNLKSVILNKVTELNYSNLSHNYIKTIFDFENSKFRDNSHTNEETNLWVNEFVNKNTEYAKLTKKGVRIYKKIIFKQICYHMYWFGGEYQSSNSSFQIDYGFKEKILVPNQNSNNIDIVESYHYYCLEDLISNNPDFFCFSWWKLFQYR